MPRTRILGALVSLTLFVNAACTPLETVRTDQTTTTEQTTTTSAQSAGPEIATEPDGPGPQDPNPTTPDLPEAPLLEPPGAPPGEPPQSSGPSAGPAGPPNSPGPGGPPRPPSSVPTPNGSTPQTPPGAPPASDDPRPSTPSEGPTPPTTSTTTPTATAAATTTTTTTTSSTTTTRAEQSPTLACGDVSVAASGQFSTYNFWVMKSCFQDPEGGELQAFSTPGHYGSVSAPTNAQCQSLAGNAWCWTYTPTGWDGSPYWDAFNIWAEDAAGNASEPLRFDLCVNC